MAIGDDGVLGGMPLVPGSIQANTLDTEHNRDHDYIAGGPTYWKPGVTVPISKGGTGATTAPTARTALGLPSAGAAVAATPNTLALRYPDGTIDAVQFATASDPTLPNHCTRKAYVDAKVAGIDLSSRVAKSGDTMTGHLWIPNAVPATQGYTVLYWNGDGRVSKGASSERYKDDITPIDPIQLGDIFPQLHTFVMKDDPGRMQRTGYIAERLNESDDLRQFVVYEREQVYEDVLAPIYDEEGEFIEERVVDRRIVGSRRSRDEDGNPIPDSIDFIALLLAQVAQLHARDQQRELELQQLAARVEALEAKP